MSVSISKGPSCAFALDFTPVEQVKKPSKAKKEEDHCEPKATILPGNVYIYIFKCIHPCAFPEGMVCCSHGVRQLLRRGELNRSLYSPYSFGLTCDH